MVPGNNPMVQSRSCTRTGRFVVLAACMLMLAGSPVLAQLFEVNVDNEKRLIEGHMRELRDLLAVNKLQSVRATLRLINDKVELIKKDIERAERAAYKHRIDSVTALMTAKEDSLVGVAKRKLYDEGMDEALDYVQTALRRIGLPQSRFDEIDEMFMEEAPRVQQRKEDEAMARAVTALRKGRSVPDDIDPYIAMTAKRKVQSERDSVRAARREGQERQREEAEAERERKAELESKRLEEQRELAEMAEEQKQERERDEEKALREAEAEREKAVREAEQEAAKAERERQREMEEVRRREQGRQDSLAALQAERERLIQEVAAREAKRRQQEAELEELRRRQAEQEAEARAEERAKMREEQERREAELAAEREATARLKDEQKRLEAQKAEIERIAKEEEQQRRLREEQEAREKRVAEQRQEEERLAALNRLNEGKTTYHETAAAKGQTKSVRDYIRQRKEEETRAQKVVVQIYELLDRENSAKALKLFKARRDYLAEYLGKEVFLVLERAVATAAISAGTSAQTAAAPAAVTPVQQLPKEQQYIMRIDQYYKQRKWEQVVSLFDGTKKQLKAYMTKADYKKLRAKVDSARQFVED